VGRPEILAFYLTHINSIITYYLAAFCGPGERASSRHCSRPARPRELARNLAMTLAISFAKRKKEEDKLTFKMTTALLKTLECTYKHG